jgi:hypothetical protein
MQREFLADAPPLPSAEELAAPIVAGLEAVHDAFDQRAEALEYDINTLHSPGTRQAGAVRLVEIAERVAMILRREIRANPLASVSGRLRAPDQIPPSRPR